jgi:hypothetical protein
MLFSIYPTDDEATRDAILDVGSAGLCFTSLHIPESSNLRNYLAYLKASHEKRGCSFFADISPLALERLDLTLDTVGALRDYGICGLRIDFGFSIEEIKRLAASGLDIAVNASTVDESFLVAMKDYTIIGWHNYYPRPDTGISTAFFQSQNALFLSRGLPIYTFIPGERSFRAPLHMGLPMLEGQRYKNAWRNYMEIKSLCPQTEVVSAEGVPFPRHLEWIADFETKGIVTIPLIGVDPAQAARFNGREYRVRVDESDVSWRLENSRAQALVDTALRGEDKAKGSVQMDMATLGRYEGELHLMRRSMPLDSITVQVAEIPAAYKVLVDFITGGITVKFVVY